MERVSERHCDKTSTTTTTKTKTKTDEEEEEVNIWRDKRGNETKQSKKAAWSISLARHDKRYNRDLTVFVGSCVHVRVKMAFSASSYSTLWVNFLVLSSLSNYRRKKKMEKMEDNLLKIIVEIQEDARKEQTQIIIEPKRRRRRTTTMPKVLFFVSVLVLFLFINDRLLNRKKSVCICGRCRRRRRRQINCAGRSLLDVN